MIIHIIQFDHVEDISTLSLIITSMMTSYAAIESRPQPKTTTNTPTILLHRLSLPSVLYRVLNKVLTLEYMQSTSNGALNDE